MYIMKVYHIHKNGWTKLEEGVNVNELHYIYANEKGRKIQKSAKLIGLRGDGDEVKSKLL